MSERTLALVFPGQGSQFVGMGTDLCQEYAAARAVYTQADDILGFSLSKLCFEGPAAELDDTANTQPAIYATTWALWQVLQPRLEGALERVACLAGHSLGEFCALTAAGALDFADGLRLVRCRGEAMRDAGASAPGGMVAILGLSDDVVARIVAQANADTAGAWVANYNAPGQVVIAGQEQHLEAASALAKQEGAKRVVPLAVSVACHTPLMQDAANRLGLALEGTVIQRPWAPVVSNAQAAPLSEPGQIKAALLQQLTSSVRWVESMQGMVSQGVTTMLEIGPRSVVSALIRRITSDVKTYSVSDIQSLQGFSGAALL